MSRSGSLSDVLNASQWLLKMIFPSIFKNSVEKPLYGHVQMIRRNKVGYQRRCLSGRV